MSDTLSTIFIDSRKAAKIANFDVFGILDLLEVSYQDDSNVSLKIKSLLCMKEEWSPCINYSDKIQMTEDEMIRYLKNDRHVSGIIWIPIKNTYNEVLSLLNSKKIRSIVINEELSQQVHSADIKNVNSILQDLGKSI